MKGRAAKLEEHAAIIAQRVRAGETLGALCQEYQCGHAAIKGVVGRYISIDEWAAILLRTYKRAGRAGGFKKGYVPWNKGRKGFRSSPATEFKKGGLRGQAARNWIPVGAVTIRRDKPAKRLRSRKRKAGMPPWPRRQRRYIKIKDDGRPQDRWCPYARYVWQQANGPVPAGLSVVHLDGDTMNDSLANLAIVPRRLLPALARALNPDLDAVRLRRANAGRRQRIAAKRLVTAHRKLIKRSRHIWQCHACSFGSDDATSPARCPRCGGEAFERIRVAS